MQRVGIKHSNGNSGNDGGQGSATQRACAAAKPLTCKRQRKIWRSQQTEEGREMRPSIFKRAPGESGEREDSTAAPLMHRWRA